MKHVYGYGWYRISLSRMSMSICPRHNVHIFWQECGVNGKIFLNSRIVNNNLFYTCNIHPQQRRTHSPTNNQIAKVSAHMNYMWNNPYLSLLYGVKNGFKVSSSIIYASIVWKTKEIRILQAYILWLRGKVNTHPDVQFKCHKYGPWFIVGPDGKVHGANMGPWTLLSGGFCWVVTSPFHYLCKCL